MLRYIFGLAVMAILSHGQVVLAMSVEKEIELGATEHSKIVAQYGVYQDRDLGNYITMVGERIAKLSSGLILNITSPFWTAKRSMPLLYLVASFISPAVC